MFVLLEKVFADELPLCTQEGCAELPKKEGLAHKGLVKPGQHLQLHFGST